MKEIYESVQQYILENPEYKILREEDKLWLDEVHTELGVRLNNKSIINVPWVTSTATYLPNGVTLNSDGRVVTYNNLPCKTLLGGGVVNRVTVSTSRLDEVESKLKLLEDWIESLSNKISSSERHSGITVYEYFNNLNK